MNLVKCRKKGKKKEKRRRQKTFPREKWTEPGDWQYIVDQVQHKFQERGGITATRQGSECTMLVMFWGSYITWMWKGPGPLCHHSLVPHYNIRKRTPNEVKVCPVTKQTAGSWEWNPVSCLSSELLPQQPAASFRTHSKFPTCHGDSQMPHSHWQKLYYGTSHLILASAHDLLQESWLLTIRASKPLDWLCQDLPEDKPALSFYGETSSDGAVSPDTVMKVLVNLKARVNKTQTILWGSLIRFWD